LANIERVELPYMILDVGHCSGLWIPTPVFAGLW